MYRNTRWPEFCCVQQKYRILVEFCQNMKPRIYICTYVSTRGSTQDWARDSRIFGCEQGRKKIFHLHQVQTDRASDRRWGRPTRPPLQFLVHHTNPRQLLPIGMLCIYRFPCEMLSWRPSFHPLGGLATRAILLHWGRALVTINKNTPACRRLHQNNIDHENCRPGSQGPPNSHPLPLTFDSGIH